MIKKLTYYSQKLEELLRQSEAMGIIPLKNSFEPLAFARVADEQKI